VLGALGVGCWALGVGCPEAATTRSPDRGTSRGVSLRRSEAPLTLASRSVEVIFWFGRWVLLRALGVGRWVRGRATPGALGVWGVGDEVTLPGLRWPV
jgi:hypothetical protein